MKELIATCWWQGTVTCQKPSLEGRSLWVHHTHTSHLVEMCWYPTETLISISMMTQDAYVLISHSDVLSCAMSMQVLCPSLKLGFIFFLLIYKSSLYILDMSSFFVNLLQTSLSTCLGKFCWPQSLFQEDLSFYFRPMIHLKLIFAYGRR